MQILKDDIRQRILATAREEFIAHGVRSTSIRTVARKPVMFITISAARMICCARYCVRSLLPSTAISFHTTKSDI